MGIAIDQQGCQIDQDIPCISCRYNLRGLQRDGKCPECGSLIWGSFLQQRLKRERGLAPLETADPQWLLELYEGTGLVVLASILFSIQACILIGGLGWRLPVGLATSCSIWALCWYGSWKLGTPEPDYGEKIFLRFYRQCITVYTLFLVILAIIDYLNDLIVLLACAVLIAGLIASVMHYILISRYARRLDCRWIHIPSLVLVCISPLTFFAATAFAFRRDFEPYNVLPDMPVFSLNSAAIAGLSIHELIETGSTVPLILLGYFLLIGMVHVGLWLKLRNVMAQLKLRKIPVEQR